MSEPVVASRIPYGIEVEAGKDYYWCRCGLSQKQPFCDGSHKTTDFTPVKWTAAETKKAFFCGCKHTDNQPLCDGTHSTLAP